MEFVIAKKDFNSAVRQILVGREATSLEPVELTVDQSFLKIEAMGTDVQVPVETKTTGVARVSISNIAVLKKISRTYKTESIDIRIADGYIHFERTSIRIKSQEKKNTRRDLFSDAESPVSPDDQQKDSEVSNHDEQTLGGKQMSESEMQAELERLRAENAQLKNKDKGGISLKVSEKGALSLYGMGRFPVTLYKEQWLRVLEHADEIKTFIAENDSKLKAKE